MIQTRYGPRAWVSDAVLGVVGSLLLGLWTVVLLPSVWAILPGLGLAGSLYLVVRALWLGTLVYRLDETGVLTRTAALVADKRVDLSAIRRADLHYLGTLIRGARGKSGLFVLHLSDTSTKLRIESKIEDFHPLAKAVLEAHIAAGLPISLATFDNAQALELDAGLKTDMISRPL